MRMQAFDKDAARSRRGGKEVAAQENPQAFSQVSLHDGKKRKAVQIRRGRATVTG